MNKNFKIETNTRTFAVSAETNVEAYKRAVEYLKKLEYIIEVSRN